jgi:hypothetical protein
MGGAVFEQKVLDFTLSRTYVRRSGSLSPGRIGLDWTRGSQPMIPDITSTSSPYEDCRKLFADYPLAARLDVCDVNTVSSMVLMLQDDERPRFFVLSHRRGDRPGYLVYPWPAGSIVEIMADTGAEIPDAVRRALSGGVPIPRDGSLFGWSGGDAIAALVVIDAVYTPASPSPSWTVMPLAGIPEAEWPPFTREPTFGYWFWEHYRAGSVISLSDPVAATPDTVFWVDTKSVLGSDCCVVTRDMSAPRGQTLRRGCYVYYAALQADQAVPPPSALLAGASKIDLAPRFQLWKNGEETSPGEF